MRAGMPPALVAVALLVLLAPPAPAQGEPARALVAFLPAEPTTAATLLPELARRGLAVGLASPTVGGYSPVQALLDVGQGTRVPSRIYRGPLPRLRLVPDSGGGRLAGWPEAIHRAERVPGKVVPGLLGESVRRAGRRVAYAGSVGVDHLEAAVAADRAGRIARVSVGSESTLARRAVRLWTEADLMVTRLPSGAAGLAALDRLLALRQPGDLVVVMQAPPEGPLRLLPTAVGGPGYRGLLRSPTTRRPGLVAATDLAPTVLARLGVPVPEEMEGRRIGSRPEGGPDDVTDLAARLDVLPGRRVPTLLATLAGWLLLLAGSVIAGGWAGTRLVARIGFLAVLWLPGVALVTAALEPSRQVEVAALALGSLALGAITDRLMAWPTAPAVPAAVVFAAHAVDLAAGSPLIAASLAGPNPKGGARFYGVGNELEAVLAVSVLLGGGAALARADAGRRIAGFALAGLAAAAVLGAGRLGADAGAVITLGAGTAAAAVAARGARRADAAWWVWPGVAILVPAAALGALAAVDALTGGGAHLTGSVLEADRPSDIVDVAERRLRLSYESLEAGIAPLAVTAAAVLLAAGVASRHRLLGPLDAAPAFRAGLAGGLAATVVGALANDSGPTIFLIGTGLLAMAVAYAHAAPGSQSSVVGRPGEGRAHVLKTEV